MSREEGRHSWKLCSKRSRRTGRAKWRRVFDRHWHAYSRWFLREGIRRRPTYLDSLKAVRQHMPELLPLYEEIVKRRAAAIWRRASCPCGARRPMSAAVRRRSCDGPAALIRNYDYSPKLLEGTWLASRFCGKRVLAMVDCLWGVLDGINEDGLAASLAFGGRTAVGEGFRHPDGPALRARIRLECRRGGGHPRARPVHMSYTVALIAEGHHATVFVTPDRPTEVIDPA